MRLYIDIYTMEEEKVKNGLHYSINNQFTLLFGLDRKFNINICGRYMDEMRIAPGLGEIKTNEKTGACLSLMPAQIITYTKIYPFSPVSRTLLTRYIL